MLMLGASGCTSRPPVLRVTVQCLILDCPPAWALESAPNSSRRAEGVRRPPGWNSAGKGTVGRLPTNDPPVLAYCEPK